MGEVVTTLIAADCDPQCKWLAAAEQLSQDGRQQAADVPREPYGGNPEDMRPTPQGYVQLEEIAAAFRGASLLVSAAGHCTRACVIERYAVTADGNVRTTLGSRVQEVFKGLKG